MNDGASESAFAAEGDPWEAARALLAASRASGRLGARGVMTRARQVRALIGSGHLDHEWYARRYGLPAGPGLRARAALDLVGPGALQGRDPGPDFDTRFYYAANPDVARAGWSALAHYEIRGRDERRRTHPAGPPGLPFQLAVIEASPLFDPNWYAEAHPEVGGSQLTPAEHYLTEGAARGLRPGPDFAPPDAAPGRGSGGSAVNPLVAALLTGDAPSSEDGEPRTVAGLRDALLSLGFTDVALDDLEAIATDEGRFSSRPYAAAVLARWHLRRPDGAEDALRWIDLALDVGRDEDLAARLAAMRPVALARFGRPAEPPPLGAPGPLRLSHATAGPEETRLEAVSEALRGWGLPGLSARAEPLGPGLYGRLRSEPVPPVTDGPLISVIVAAHNAEATLPLTLAALSEQSWRRHEVIVVDDASTDGTRAVAEGFAERDPRVRVIGLDRNVGAYAARNRALALARGRLVTLQDADDWSGATRLEVQARHLLREPRVIANTSQHARLTEDLAVARFSVGGDLVFPCQVSIMFRRGPVRARLGGWDEVRFGADSELMRRIGRAFGEAALAHLPTGPVTLQRFAAGSATAHPDTGFDGAFHGARLEYHEAQRHHHAGGPLRYKPGTRPFPVPAIMLPGREETSHLDVVIASELRMKGGSVQSCLQEIDAQRAGGLTTGIVKMYRYGLEMRGGSVTHEPVRERVDGRSVRMLVRGERATCDLLILRYPPVLQHPLRGLPDVEPRRIKVIVNQPPVSDYSETGELRYDIPRAEANLRAAFGGPGEWHPIGPLIRDALHAHHAADLGAIDLRPDDWTNVIDVDAWDLGRDGRPRRGRGPMRIGRHSRDNAVKWPDGAEAILEVYPDAPDVAVHVLGGAASALRQIGREPAGWRVTPFGGAEPRAFLREIDVFVYYTHPAWVESFGRCIIEAMAAGVPAVLPPHFEPVFGDAATYAPAALAVETARALHGDPARHRAQALRAQRIVRERFGSGLHLTRLREAGVGGGAS